MTREKPAKAVAYPIDDGTAPVSAPHHEPFGRKALELTKLAETGLEFLDKGEFSRSASFLHDSVELASGLDKAVILLVLKRVLQGEAVRKIALAHVDFVRLLNDHLATLGIAQDQRVALAKQIEEMIALAQVPKWRARAQSREFRSLTAPLFLKQVHAARMEVTASGYRVKTEDIRPVDPELMDAVIMYIANRKRLGLDLGDAADLHIVTQRPAPNLRPKGARADVGPEAVRERNRRYARDYRLRKSQRRDLG